MAKVLKELQKHLPKEIAANVRYAGHAEIIRYHGYPKLADKYIEEAAEEREHANEIIRRIQQLGAMPCYNGMEENDELAKWDIKALLSSDLAFECSVDESIHYVCDCAEEESDYVTSEVMRHLAMDTAGHIQWLTTELAKIEELGVQNYLQAQI